MLFVIDNRRNFWTGWNVRGLHTRNTNQLFMPTLNLSVFQQGIICSGIRIFTSLPTNIQHLRNDRAHFKNKLCTYLVTNPFYSISEF